MLERDRLKRLAIINNDDVSWGKCKSFRNEVNIALRKVKRAFHASQIENVIGNPRSAWKLNNILERKQSADDVSEIMLNDLSVYLGNCENIQRAFH